MLPQSYHSYTHVPYHTARKACAKYIHVHISLMTQLSQITQPFTLEALKKDDQPLLKCQKCDVCYKCLGLAPCPEPTINDHNPKHKRIRSVLPQQTKAHSKRPKPNPLPLPLSATTYPAAKIDTDAHKRKKTLAKIARQRARAAQTRTRLRAVTTTGAHTSAVTAPRPQPDASSHAAFLARIAATQKRAATKNKRAYRPTRVSE